MAVEKRRSIASGAGPPIGEAIQAAHVDGFRAPRAFGALQQQRVVDGEDREYEPVGHRPPWRHSRTNERLPHEHGADRSDHQPGVRDDEMPAIENRDARAPLGQAALVLNTWVVARVFQASDSPMFRNSARAIAT